MLFEGRIFMKKLIALVPNNIFESFLNLQFQIGEQMGGFVRAKILQSIIVGVVTFVGLLFLNFPYALVLAIVAGVLNIIPYLGPILAFIPAVIIHIANGSSNELLFGLILVYVIAQILDTVIITPFVVAKIVDMHPVTVVLVVLVGAQFMGILGMIICIPLYSALKVTTLAVYRHLTDFRT
jgi:predicted PurR-regulated permease PerM